MRAVTKIFDGLVSRDEKLRLVPALAEQLKQGVKFSDGTPLTARDVVFTYTSVLNPKVNSTIASRYDALADVTAPDERTVQFRLKYPYSPFAQYLTLGIVPGKAFDGVGINSAPFNTAPVGTGLYTVTQWRKGDRMVLKANEKYTGMAPAIKTATFVFIAATRTTRTARPTHWCTRATSASPATST